MEKRVCGLTLLERGIRAYLSCLSEHARLFTFSVSHELPFISCDHIDRACRTEQLLERGIHAYLSCLSDVFVASRF